MASLFVYELVGETYPFRGVWRWAVLPGVFAVLGALDGLGGWLLQDEEDHWHYVAIFVLPELHKGLAQGLALALGRGAGLSIALASAFGFAVPWMNNLVLVSLPLGIYDASTGTVSKLLCGAGEALMMSAHRVYLRARRSSGRARAGAWGVYVLAGLGAALAWVWVHFGSPLPRVALTWGGQDALVAWLSLALAARLAERGGTSA